MKRLINKMHLNFILGLGFLFYGCSLSPTYEDPEVNLPYALPTQASLEKISKTWWEDFNDQTLNILVQEALDNNYDLAVAMQRVEQARSSWSYARSDRYPNISAQGEGVRTKANESDPKNYYNSFSLSAVLSFELDLWGRARDADRSAYAKLLASKANRDTVRLSLIANVAESYFGILTFNNQVELSKKTLKAREENYEYLRKEFEVGKTSEMDMQQARSEMASVRAQLQSLMMEQNAAQTSLMILLGRDPQALFDVQLPTQAKNLPKAPIVPVGIPSSVLEQRPDIEMATQNLKSANFAIGVARSAYFPIISLTGMAGYVSPEFNELIRSSNSTWNYGGNFIANLLDFGRTSANVRLSESQYEEMLLNYGQTVRNAFGEVRDSLFNYSTTQEKVKSVDEQVEALQRALILADLRYKEGYSNYLEVLNMQSSLFAAELNQQSAKLENLSAAISLYKAFGGGWDKETYDIDEE